MPPPYTSDQELAWRTLASETAEAIYSGEVPGRAPQLDDVSRSVGMVGEGDLQNADGEGCGGCVTGGGDR